MGSETCTEGVVVDAVGMAGRVARLALGGLAVGCVLRRPVLGVAGTRPIPVKRSMPGDHGWAVNPDLEGFFDRSVPIEPRGTLQE